MSRSGYSDDCDDWELIMWRGAVNRAIRGKRGQAFLRELIAAMDAMPAKRLIAHDLIKDGEVCAIGSVAVARSTNVSGLDPYNSEAIAKCMGIAESMVKEIEFINDECCYPLETPEHRFSRVYQWGKEHIKEPGPKE